MTLAFPKPTKVRSNALRRSARGRSCCLRLPGVCCHDDATVVLCHLPGHDRGMGTKTSDMHAVYGCFSCHSAIDGRTRTNLGDALILEAMLRALSETQALMVEAGLITVKE